MIRALSSFMEFCYLVRRSVLDEDDLVAIDTAVANFHRDRVAFDDVRPDGYSSTSTFNCSLHFHDPRVRGRPMASVPRLLNLSTSRQSRNRGGAPVVLKLSVK
jgi:hypothetical protein